MVQDNVRIQLGQWFQICPRIATLVASAKCERDLKTVLDLNRVVNGFLETQNGCLDNFQPVSCESNQH